MSSIAILATAPRVFYFALVVAVLGAFFTLNGFFMIFPIPLFH
jgi:Flp pilus assembly protein protease CpaA